MGSLTYEYAKKNLDILTEWMFNMRQWNGKSDQKKKKKQHTHTYTSLILDVIISRNKSMLPFYHPYSSIWGTVVNFRTDFKQYWQLRVYPDQKDEIARKDLGRISTLWKIVLE